MDKYPDIKFNDLTDSQMGEMSDTDIINKALAEYVVDINYDSNTMISSIRHSILVTILMIISIYLYGFVWSFGLIPLTFFIVRYFMFKKSIVWRVRSFKSTASMYSCLGYDYLIDKHINNIDNLEGIGDLYDFK